MAFYVSRMPLISVIIAVYNDWTPLYSCLNSLAQQKNFENFEVIVVDDGSELALPDSVENWKKVLQMSLLRQEHAGVSAARNRGICASSGSILLFVDADCRLDETCLHALSVIMERFGERNWFQLRLEGDGLGLVGRTEKLRLRTLQHQLLQPDGTIQYLNTAGFAWRRTPADAARRLFDETVTRGEDTLLLAELVASGLTPMFVPDAVVHHVVSLSIAECLSKDTRSAYLETRAYGIIASRGIRIRMDHSSRRETLAYAWRISQHDSIRRAAWWLLLLRQSLRMLVRTMVTLFSHRSGARVPAASTL